MIVHSGGSAFIAGPHGLGRSDRLGLAFWFAFAIVAVAARGVRWDEAYEHAQILSGQIPYPHDHPLYRYVHNGFSLQTYLSAVVVWLVPNPIVLCGIRNVLFILASALPAYLFARRLTGETIWGHAAAALTMSGVWLEFDSSYPLAVWPSTFTNGYLGGAYMLVTMFLVLTNRFRLGLFLLGLAPAIHVGELPAILPVCGLYLAWNLVRDARAEVLRALPWGIASVAITVAFGMIMRLYHVPAPVPPSAEAIAQVWQGYTAYFDPHRQFPPANALIATIAALLLGLGAMQSMSQRDALWAWLFLYVASVALVVAGVMAAHAVLGKDIPFLLIGWMPYRLLNLVLPVLLASVIGVLGSREEKGSSAGSWLLCAALGLSLMLPIVRTMTGSEILSRYFASGEFVLFALIGAAYARLSRQLISERAFFVGWQIAAAACFVGLALIHQFGAVSFILGALGMALVESMDTVRAKISPRRIALVLAASLAVLGVIQESVNREQLPRSDFDRQVTAYLTNQSAPNAMLLAHPYEFLLQARTDHPALVETATASLMSYLPELGPSIQQTYEDLYGIRFDQPPAPTAKSDWKGVWAARSADEWRALAEKYGFDYVLAPADTALQMESALTSDRGTLYKADRLRFTAVE